MHPYSYSYQILFSYRPSLSCSILPRLKTASFSLALHVHYTFLSVIKQVLSLVSFVFFHNLFCQDSSINSESGANVYPISSHFVSSSSKISPFVFEVLCNKTIAPGWILVSSLSNASSFVG